MAENSTAVTTVIASDADLPGDTLTYSIIGGADAAVFSIDAGGALTFNAAPNFEVPADDGNNNVYDVQVQVSDGTNTDTQALAITVTNVNESAVSAVSDSDAAANAVAENAANGTVVGIDALATDADTSDTITYSLTDASSVVTDAGGRFTINTSTGVVTVANGTLLDREAAASHDITVRADSSDGSFSVQTFTIALTPVNDNSPVITSNGAGATGSASVAENSTAVTTVIATDADLPGDALTYSIIGGDDAALFSIDAGGALTFNAAPNFEAPADAGNNNVYDVQVQVSDGANTDSQALAITVTNVNEGAVSAVSDSDAAANAVVENAANGTVVGIDALATDTDTSDTITYSLTDASSIVTDAGGRFTINTSTGVVTVANGTLLDREAATSHGITIRADSSDGSFSVQTFTIALTPVNDNLPVITSNGGGATGSASVAENSTAVTTVTATDADLPGDTLTYSIIGGADAALFSIDTGGALTFNAAPNFESPSDSGTNNVYDVQVQVSDGTNTDTQALVITVTNVNEAPNAVSSQISMVENGRYTLAIGDFRFSDVDAGDTLTLVRIDRLPLQGALTLSNTPVTALQTIPVTEILAGNLVYTPTNGESGTPYTTIEFSVADSSNEFSITRNTLTIDVAALNERPVLTGNSGAVVAEGAQITLDRSFLELSDADTPDSNLTYLITRLPENGLLLLDAAPLEIGQAFTQDDVDNGRLSYHHGGDETRFDRWSFSFSDGSSPASLSNDFLIDVTPVNDSPTLAALNAIIPENSASGTLITTMVGNDPDTGDQLTYTIRASNLPGAFSINPDSGQIYVTDGSRLDFETLPGQAARIELTVEATDRSGASAIALAILDLSDLNEAPTSATLRGGTANLQPDALLGQISVADQDADESFAFTMLDDADGRFRIDAVSGEIFTRPTVTSGNTPASRYDVRIQIVDSAGNQLIRDFGLTLLSVTQNDTGSEGPDVTPPLAAPPESPTPVSTLDPRPTLSVDPAPDSSGTPILSSPADTRSDAEVDRDSTREVLSDSVDSESLISLDEDSRRRSNIGQSNRPIAADNDDDEYQQYGPAGAMDSFEQGPSLDASQLLANLKQSAHIAELTEWLGEAESRQDSAMNEWARQRMAIQRGDLTFVVSHEDSPANVEDPENDSGVSQLTVATMTAGKAMVTGAAIWWAARAAGILTAMLIGVPAWRTIDPLPILMRSEDDVDSRTNRHDVDEEETEGDADAYGVLRNR